MTDLAAEGGRTNLDVAFDVAEGSVPVEIIRAQFDAIHPALAHLTPDDVAILVACFLITSANTTSAPNLIRIREVLSK